MKIVEKYINPFTDFGFKKLFGTEPNKDLLIDFLNQVLPPIHQIQDLTYLNNEHLGNAELDRKAVFDLYCISNSGERFIVEMQKAKQNYFKDRSVYYSTFPIQEQALRGDWNFKLSAIYTVGILDFIFSEDKHDKEVLHTVQLKNQKNVVFFDKLTYIYLELPKFNKMEDDLKTGFDKWLYILKRLPELEKRPAALQERVFQKLFEAAEIAKFSKKESELYESSLKYYRDLKNVIDTAEDEGERKGIEKTINKVAIEMLKEGETVSKIAKYTGLTEEEIESLKTSSL